MLSGPHLTCHSVKLFFLRVSHMSMSKIHVKYFNEGVSFRQVLLENKEGIEGIIESFSVSLSLIKY